MLPGAAIIRTGYQSRSYSVLKPWLLRIRAVGGTYQACAYVIANL